MKALIISDIHGNIDGLEAVWNAEKDSNIILCIGDLVDVGFFGKDVVQWMIDHRVFCVRGNHDDKFINYADRALSGVAIPSPPYSPISYSYSQMGEEHINFLKKRPDRLEIEIDGILYGLCHIYHKYKVIDNKKDFELFSKEKFGRVVDRMIFGHTHYQLVKEDEYMWMNPGSIFYNRGSFDNSKNSFYITIEDGKVNLKNVEYDNLETYEKMHSITCMSGRYMRRIDRKIWKNLK